MENADWWVLRTEIENSFVDLNVEACQIVLTGRIFYLKEVEKDFNSIFMDFWKHWIYIWKLFLDYMSVSFIKVCK